MRVAVEDAEHFDVVALKGGGRGRNDGVGCRGGTASEENGHTLERRCFLRRCRKRARHGTHPLGRACSGDSGDCKGGGWRRPSGPCDANVIKSTAGGPKSGCKGYAFAILAFKTKIDYFGVT